MDKDIRSIVVRALDKVLKVFEAYNQIAKGYVFWRSRPWPIAKLGGRGIILDLGAGTCINGVYAYNFDGKYLLCIDVSYMMNFLSRKILIKEKILGDSIAGDMLFLPLRDSSVDSVIAIASLHHIPRELIHIVIKEIKRIATNNAMVVITTWSWRQPRFVIPMIVNLLLKAFGLFGDVKEYEIPWKRKSGAVYRYYRLYSLEELVALCKRYGLKVLSYGYIGYLKNISSNTYVIAKVVK